jgi:hypothetical protein
MTVQSACILFQLSEVPVTTADKIRGELVPESELLRLAAATQDIQILGCGVTQSLGQFELTESFHERLRSEGVEFLDCEAPFTDLDTSQVYIPKPKSSWIQMRALFRALRIASDIENREQVLFEGVACTALSPITLKELQARSQDIAAEEEPENPEEMFDASSEDLPLITVPEVRLWKAVDKLLPRCHPLLHKLAEGGGLIRIEWTELSPNEISFYPLDQLFLSRYESPEDVQLAMDENSPFDPRPFDGPQIFVPSPYYLDLMQLWKSQYQAYRKKQKKKP